MGTTATAVIIRETGLAQGVQIQAGRYELSDADLGFGTGDHFRSALIDGIVAASGLSVKVPTFFYVSELEEGRVTVLVDTMFSGLKGRVEADVAFADKAVA